MFDLRYGDCLEVLPGLTDRRKIAVIQDPPYGSRNDCDYTRFSGGITEQGRQHHENVAGDDRDFDPSPFLDFPVVVLWGYHYFAQRVPLGTVLVWNKKRNNQLGAFLSDCELGWQKGGHGVYLFNHVWHGFDRQTERGEGTLHPNQKPVALWDWVLERLDLPTDWTIFDGYMGSGSCGVAAVRRGYNYIGCEIAPPHFETAQKRIKAAQNEMHQLTLEAI